jgi:MFS family permease
VVHVGVAVITLDISLTSTALPAIALGVGSSASEAIWIINAYYLSVVAALLPMGALGEIHGHRRVFFIGLLTFAAGSLACGLAWSRPTLAAARAVLGLGAAAVSAATPALIRSLYPSRAAGADPAQLHRPGQPAQARPVHRSYDGQIAVDATHSVFVSNRLVISGPPLTVSCSSSAPST